MGPLKGGKEPLKEMFMVTKTIKTYTDKNATANDK